MAQFVESVVVGAGVVGLAVSRALARAGREVLVIDAAESIGSITSARNSEVIHAGIYYTEGSLKARACVQGRRMLYDYCQRHGVPFRRCGKLIVATCPEQVSVLEHIREKAARNGVTDLRVLQRSEAKAMEPALDCSAALLSPSTGIVDSHAFMLSLQGELEDAGGMIALKSPLTGGRLPTTTGSSDKIQLSIGGETPMELSCVYLINAGGLAAPRNARLLQGLPNGCIPREYYAKGNYYSLLGKSPFQMLVYPVPEQAGLGVHATVDLQGQTRFGPDVEWVADDSDYDVDPQRADSFYQEVRKYWPALPDGALVPDYSGIRPKISGPGEASADFMVQGPLEHGIPGLVNLFGIESPGLTGSLALAEYVLQSLGIAEQAT